MCTWAREWGVEYYTLLFTCNIVKWYHICLNKGHLITIWNLKKSSKSLHMSVSLFFKVNRHETFQIFGRYQIFLISKYVLQNYLILSENCKSNIFGKCDRDFQIFYLEFSWFLLVFFFFFLSVLQFHTWKYWYVCSDEYGINCKCSVVFASLLKTGCRVVLIEYPRNSRGT